MGKNLTRKQREEQNLVGQELFLIEKISSIKDFLEYLKLIRISVDLETDKKGENMYNFVSFIDLCYTDFPQIQSYLERLENSYLRDKYNVKTAYIKEFKKSENKTENGKGIDLNKQVVQYLQQIGFYAAMINYFMDDSTKEGEEKAKELLNSRFDCIITYDIEDNNIVANVKRVLFKKYIFIDITKEDLQKRDLNRFIAILNQLQGFMYNKFHYAYLIYSNKKNNDNIL